METAKLNRLLKLEKEVEKMRQELGVSGRGEILFQAPRSMWSDCDVVVEADGRGGAMLMIVEGNYPADYLTHRQQVFLSEEEACDAAERLVEPTTPKPYRTTPE